MNRLIEPELLAQLRHVFGSGGTGFAREHVCRTSPGARCSSAKLSRTIVSSVGMARCAACARRRERESLNEATKER